MFHVEPWSNNEQKTPLITRRTLAYVGLSQETQENHEYFMVFQITYIAVAGQAGLLSLQLKFYFAIFYLPLNEQPNQIVDRAPLVQMHCRCVVLRQSFYE